MAVGNPIRRIGVLLTAAEWSILFEALRRVAMENERPVDPTAPGSRNACSAS